MRFEYGLAFIDAVAADQITPTIGAHQVRP